MSSELRVKKTIIPDMESNLRSSKLSCDNMVNRVQEHCPDIDRQEADVQKLSKRYDNLLRQIDTRYVFHVYSLLKNDQYGTQKKKRLLIDT